MKNLFLFLTLLVLSVSANAQQNQIKQDSTSREKLDEVLVKAVRVDADSPITHSNVDKEELAKRNLGQDIPILLNYLPSVVTTSDAGAGIGYTGIRVRGISGASTNVTINGIPYNDAESLGTFWVNLQDFSSSVENLQVQRGVGSTTNGAGAFGASVNILTDAVSKESSGETSHSFGSFNTRRHNVKFSTGLLNDTFELAGRLSQIKSDGYIDRATSNLKSYFVQGSYVNNGTLIKAVVFGGHEITYQSWYGFNPVDVAAVGANPDIDENRRFNISGIQLDDNGNFEGFYDNQVDDYKQDHYQLHWNQRWDNNWSTNLGLNYTNGRGFFEEYVDNYYYSNVFFASDASFDFIGKEPITVNGATVDSQDYVRRRWLDNDFYVANANVNYKNERVNFISGISYSSYHGDHFGELIWEQYAANNNFGDRYYEGDGDKYDFSAFSKITYRLNDKLSLYGDVQYRGINYDTSGINSDLDLFEIDKSYSFFNPKVGFNYSLNTNSNLYFSYARANREPSRGDFENNPDVRPEKLNDFELGWRYKNKNIGFNANAYYMAYNEQLVATGELDNSGAQIRDNTGESYRLGLELEATLTFNKFTVQPNFTLSSNKNKETFFKRDGVLQNLGETNIAFSPDFVAGNALTFNASTNFQITLLSKYVGEQYMGNIDAEGSKLDSYFVNDLNFVYEIKPKNIFKSIVFTALINNILSEDYISNGFFFTYDDDFSNPGTISTIEGAGFYPQATRNFLVGATFKF
ncbi:TonB-dependent receptor [Seonamhaeicola sediminis]|uniref:TonB-dependent receptor n=1 Tax=Seonamhaeicola sediminis TaxID=2528206 RepID=A0A562YAQ5_9FLAO|nr:TonB-dependent receptor [Seonamhaeicola sediminis]TWO31362.1 TonB-dependent receptor [Seonamhaeicola sediminis]